ncbi:MAG: hypothetical protein VZS44_12030 [Bacilli bacterium]|nr:hypothetical protein [Bacilli bacterium]
MKCLICGKENQKLGNHIWRKHHINAQEYYDTYIGKHYCPICGKETVFRSINQGYLTYCSIKCADLDKSIFITNNPQKNPQIKQKTEETCLIKYGVRNPYQIKEVKEKCIANNHTKEALAKRTANLYRNINEFCNENNCIPLEEAMKINPCNGWWSDVTFIIYKKWRKCVSLNDLDIIKNYKPRNNKSKNEIKLYQLICNNYSDLVIQTDRNIIKPLELDIYIPKLKLAIEYNGCYFHSIEMGTDKKYHLNKSLLCREQGIRLVHIYDFEDFNQQCNLILDLLKGIDNYNPNDFNKNNLIDIIPKPKLIYNDNRLHVYGAGKLY